MKPLVSHQLCVAAEALAAVSTLVRQAAGGHQGGRGSDRRCISIGMGPLMPVQVGADVEALATLSTTEGALPCVRAPVLAVV